MKRSMLYLGEPAAFEDELRPFSSRPLGGLHVGAQRVAWGILMGPRVGLDLDVEVRALLDRYGDHFAAHVAAAIARRAQHRDDAAEEHMTRARALLPPDHPWALLVPTDAEWRADRLVPVLEEDEPGRVYRIVAENRREDAVFGNRGVARLLRMRSGELVLVNPVDFPEDLVREIRALGDVTHVVLPAKYHSDHAARACEHFPKARLFGVQAHRDYPGVQHLRFDGFLEDSAPLFPVELEHVTLHGVDVGDTWLLDCASRTLITTDALFLTRTSAPGAEAFRSPFNIFYCWAWGVFDRVGVPSYQPAMWSNVPAYQESLRRALRLDFEHVASCHGPWRCIEGDARRTLDERLGWLLGIGRLEAVGFLGDFVWRHPGVFYRLVKEQIAARRAAS